MAAAARKYSKQEADDDVKEAMPAHSRVLETFAQEVGSKSQPLPAECVERVVKEEVGLGDGDPEPGLTRYDCARCSC